jgi:outer membrane protein OmpA-like peptidoglycan-associated protein
VDLPSVALLAWVVGAQAGASFLQPPPPGDDSVRQVFFEPGGTVLSNKATEVLQLSVSIARDTGAPRELLVGHCDADEIGAGQYPALALARANAVKAALVRLGMKAETIVVTTEVGAFDPVVALNRRVSVIPAVKDNP